mmetsp:Transcript_3137/g.5424  ORF Transcript_3137/g.5424 Transcript_3137/m.5424 type:complete len:331 (-) Transcript_3137:349-1341(-)|eukprot:CAMPEP_0184700072 /NCGR_PEP_ID=MMETSP0313-20130426/8119_1 /TAXON_ID=2792 /ORGANISM="Porphyridium aerugineum, Strain SAG 1380-2" /LENGTH=330 /DNA_ID=CAMNT_0027159459 /DNA_START=86 /DNA_END=1078 /DNA_ORIENTATION=-
MSTQLEGKENMQPMAANVTNNKILNDKLYARQVIKELLDHVGPGAASRSSVPANMTMNDDPAPRTLKALVAEMSKGTTKDGTLAETAKGALQTRPSMDYASLVTLPSFNGMERSASRSSIASMGSTHEDALQLANQALAGVNDFNEFMNRVSYCTNRSSVASARRTSANPDPLSFALKEIQTRGSMALPPRQSTNPLAAFQRPALSKRESVMARPASVVVEASIATKPVVEMEENTDVALQTSDDAVSCSNRNLSKDRVDEEVEVELQTSALRIRQALTSLRSSSVARAALSILAVLSGISVVLFFMVAIVIAFWLWPSKNGHGFSMTPI